MPLQQPTGTAGASAYFLVLTVRPGSEDVVRDFLAGLPDLTRSVSFRSPNQDLATVVGIGSQLWDRLYAGPKPDQLHPFRELRGATHTAVSTPGDLLFHLRSSQQDQCFSLAKLLVDTLRGHADVVDEVHGFRYLDERDLLGFVDGTANPEGAEADEAVFLPEGDPFAGGSYVIVQKYLHDLAAWGRLSVEEQEAAIGRTKLEDVEFADEDKPSNSHVALNTIEDEHGNERDILRDNRSFGTIGTEEWGTYFIGYAADVSITETMLEHMFLGVPEGNHDRVLDFSTAHTGSLFFVPSPDFLADQPPAPGAESPGDGSLGIGSLNPNQ